MGEDKNTQQIENQLRLVMIDRMLKEKYNKIEYLAIQPPQDPNIVEINRKDLEWLISEHEKCEELEQQYGVLNSRTYRCAMYLSKLIRFFLTPLRIFRGNKS